jgi:hypothetical protein
MTVVIFRDGVMASDSGAFIGGVVTPWARKLIRGRSGIFYGGAGDGAAVSDFFRWVEAGEDLGKMVVPQLRDDDSDFIILIWRPDWGLSLMTARGEEDLRGCPYCAIGAGADVAYGALHHGATAVEAVEAAIAHSSNCAGVAKFLVAE